MVIKLIVFLFVIVCALVTARNYTQLCPNGAIILARGVNAKTRIAIVNEHNKFRWQLEQGKIPGQPAGKDVMDLKYDMALEKMARKVSDTCKMRHILGKDERFPVIGQNIYISWSTSASTEQLWTKALDYWYKEHQLYKYPQKATKKTAHYTQLIWANTSLVGCDFVHYYDASKHKFPYRKMYTCNYGPGGNIEGKAPYDLQLAQNITNTAIDGKRAKIVQGGGVIKQN